MAYMWRNSGVWRWGKDLGESNSSSQVRGLKKMIPNPSQTKTTGRGSSSKALGGWRKAAGLTPPRPNESFPSWNWAGHWVDWSTNPLILQVGNPNDIKKYSDSQP